MTKKKLLLLCIIIVFTMMGYGTVIPLNNYFMYQLGFTNLDLGLLISLYALGQLVSAPFGAVVDEIGNKKTILASFFLYIVMFILAFTLEMKTLILIFRFLSGICAGIITLSIESYIGNNVDDNLKVKYFTYSSISIGIGMILGPFLGIAIATSKIFLVVIGACAILITYILKHLLKEDVKVENNTNDVIVNLIPSFLVAIKSKINIYVLLIFMFFGIITSSLESKGFNFVLENYQLQQLNLLLVILGSIFVIVYVLIINQRISRRLNRVSYILSLIFLTSISLLIIFLSQHNVNILFVGFTLLILGLSSLMSTLTSLITSLKSKSGILLGLRNTFLFIGMVIGPILTAYTYTINPHLIFLILASLIFVMFLYGELKIKEKNNEK